MQIDDSGSMSINDGHRLVTTGKGIKSISCSRWQELMDGMQFHAKLAEVSGAITEFRLLNGAPPVVSQPQSTLLSPIMTSYKLLDIAVGCGGMG